MKELKVNKEFLLSKLSHEGLIRIYKIDNKRWRFCLEARVTGGFSSGVRVGVQGSCSIMTAVVDGVSAEIKCLPWLCRTVQSFWEVLCCDYES